MESELLVLLENIDVCQEENIVLSNASLALKKGEFIYIIGKVGSGKSSLLKALYCEVPIYTGKAFVAGYNLLKIKRREISHLRRKLGIVFQDFQLLIDRTAIKNLEFVLKATGWRNQRIINQRIEEVLEQVGMPNKGYKMPHELSGGEQQRIAIARALLNTPAIILADEPTGNLDPETSGQIVQLLHDICLTGTSVIMTTHNYNIVKLFPARVVKCQNNRLFPVEDDSSLNYEDAAYESTFDF